MLDINFIRENADLVKAGAVKKKIEVDIDRLLVLDDERKVIRAQMDDRKAEQNRMSNTIMRATGPEKDALIEGMRHVKEGFLELEERYGKVMEEW